MSFDPLLQGASRSTLFVGDLSHFCTEDHLKRIFAPYGPSVNGISTVSAEIKRGKYGDSLMHGFVYLTNIKSAEQAISDLNNKKIMGRYMRYVLWLLLLSIMVIDCEFIFISFSPIYTYFVALPL